MSQKGNTSNAMMTRSGSIKNDNIKSQSKIELALELSKNVKNSSIVSRNEICEKIYNIIGNNMLTTAEDNTVEAPMPEDSIGSIIVNLNDILRNIEIIVSEVERL